VSRVEESLHPKKSALETINDIFNPMEKVERQNTKISAVYDIVSKLSMTTGCEHPSGEKIALN